MWNDELSCSSVPYKKHVLSACTKINGRLLGLSPVDMSHIHQMKNAKAGNVTVNQHVSKLISVAQNRLPVSNMLPEWHSWY